MLLFSLLTLFSSGNYFTESISVVCQDCPMCAHQVWMWSNDLELLATKYDSVVFYDDDTHTNLFWQLLCLEYWSVFPSFDRKAKSAAGLCLSCLQTDLFGADLVTEKTNSGCSSYCLFQACMQSCQVTRLNRYSSKTDAALWCFLFS